MTNLLVPFSNSHGGNRKNLRKIPFSNVVITRTRNYFLGRKWQAVDIQVASWFIFVHLLALFAPFTFTWDAFWIAFVGYVVTGMLGVTLSYHRLLSHHSLELPKWLEYIFVYFGVLALQVCIWLYHHHNLIFLGLIKSLSSKT